MHKNPAMSSVEDAQRIIYKSQSSVTHPKPAGIPPKKPKPASIPPKNTVPAGKPPLKSIPATAVIKKSKEVRKEH
jgi:hypothetical protein